MLRHASSARAVRNAWYTNTAVFRTATQFWQAETSTSQHSLAVGDSARAGTQLFQLQQPPFELAIMFPQSQTDVKVVTGGFDCIQVRTS